MAPTTRIEGRGVIEVDATQVEAMLAKTKHATSPGSLFAFLLAGASPHLQKRTGQNFGNEATSEGSPWAQLKSATNEIRQDQGYPADHPINERSGEFRGWLTTSWGDAHATATGAELTWPSASSALNESKLAVAQAGSRRGGGRNPLFPEASTVPRPVLGLVEGDAALILAALAGHLSTMLGGGSSAGVFTVG